MENCYGIGVRNRYDLFYNDELDPLEILKQQEEERERKKTQPKEKPTSSSSKIVSKPGGKERAAVVAPASSSNPQLAKKSKDSLQQTTTKSPEFTENVSKPRNKPSGDKFPKASAGDFTSKDDRNVKRSDDQVFDHREQIDGSDFRRGRGGFRFRGRGRGRGGTFYGEGRKRDFDRQSGSDKTGVRAVEKRDGAGANNWGCTKQEMHVTEDQNLSDVWDESGGDFETENQNFPSTTENEKENVEAKENVPVISEEAIDESVREMTLDEWKREQESQRAVPKFNLRKPGEGEDGTQWKKLYMLKKKVKDEDDDGEEDEDEDGEDEEFGRRGRQRQLVDIQINFNYSRRGRGRGRGTRGTGPRTGGVPREENRNREPGPPATSGNSRLSRGQSRPSKAPAQSAPRVDDWNDFPSLVTA